MNMQPASQTRSSANVLGRQRDTGNRQESKLQLGKSTPRRSTSGGVVRGNSESGYGSLSRDRLVYLTTCLIGHHVDVQVKNGSIYTGIFHAANTENDFGIILKMARLTKDASSRGIQASSESLSKAPSKTFIIPANELVQLMAKDVSITRDGFSSDPSQEKDHEIMIDSCISNSRHVEVERELERWVPDEDDSQCPELDNIFDGPWNRNWDQFQVNEALFGVKSTFDEELYTTKLERGPQMRDLEKEASRIVKEIEGEETQDLHLAEERGKLHDDFNLDEESRFSSVLRRVDDTGYEETDDAMFDSHNAETFESSENPFCSNISSNLATGTSDNVRVFSSSSSIDEAQASQSSAVRDLYCPDSNDQASQLTLRSMGLDTESRVEKRCSEQKGGNNYVNESLQKEQSAVEDQTTKHDDSQSPVTEKKEGSDKGRLSPDASAYAPSSHASKDEEKLSKPSERSDVTVSRKTQGEKHTTSSRFSGSSLSPSSSVGSLTSERSTLNPNAKEFRLNPNAKSYVPFQVPARPVSPVPEASFYYPTGASAVPHIPGMPVGFGIGHPYAGHQPVMFNPQAASMQPPQPYFHPNGPQYGQQQMILGHPGQVMYMPGYPPPEMQYKGRDY